MADLGAIGTGSGTEISGVITSGAAILTGTGAVTGSSSECISTMAYIGHVVSDSISFLPDDFFTMIRGTNDSAFVQYVDNSGSISGTIRRNGINQANVHVALLNEQTGYCIAKAISDTNGYFTFPGLFIGRSTYTLVAWGDDYTLGLTQSNLTPTNTYILDYLDSGGSTRVQTKVLTDVAGRVRETTISSYLSYTTTIGDGASTSFVLTHNLDSRDLIIQVRRATAPYDLIDVAVEYTSVNTVTLVFASPPATNDFRVIILG